MVSARSLQLKIVANLHGIFFTSWDPIPGHPLRRPNSFDPKRCLMRKSMPSSNSAVIVRTQFVTRFTWNPEFEVRSVGCPCNQFQRKLPDRCFVHGHVAAGWEEFEFLLPNSSSVALAKAASMFFPCRNNWKSRSRALFDLWLKRNRLPHALHAGFETFRDEQRALHVQALQESDRLTWSNVQEVKSKLHHLFVL